MVNEKITRIIMPLPLGLGSVNCYLLATEAGCVLVDTGVRSGRQTLLGALHPNGCAPERLRLAVLTHGDFDHAGNAAYLQSELGVPIALHAGDARMVTEGDMFAGRTHRNPLLGGLSARLFGFDVGCRCTPDVLLADGDRLDRYGLQARVVHLPGHSSGSVGILTDAGNLFCGDLLENRRRPATGSIVDDPVAVGASLACLGELPVAMVYPGHGAPFEARELQAIIAAQVDTQPTC